MRPRARNSTRIAAVLVVTAASTVGACGDDEKKTGSVGPAGPASLAIAAPTPGEVVVLSQLPGGALAVRVTLENWTLRPPGGCAGTEQCGHVVVMVDPDGTAGALTVRGATALVLVNLTDLDEPVGSHTLRVELAEDDGSRFESNGTVLAAEVTFSVVQGDAGTADAAADAAGDGGANDATADGASDATTDGASTDAPTDAAPDAADSGAPDVDTDSTAPEASTDAGLDDAQADAAISDASAGDAGIDAMPD